MELLTIKGGVEMRNVFNSTGYEVYDTYIVRGENCYLYDEQGNKIIDFEAGVWSTVLGHSHPHINGVIYEQLQNIMHLGYRYKSRIVEEAAEKILGITSLPNGKCIFLSSGSEAVELVVQMAKRIMAKPLLLTMSGSYLSALGSASKKADNEWFSFDLSLCKGCTFVETCNPDCEILKKIPFDDIGGFVFEPGNTSGMAKLPPKGLIKNIVKRIKGQEGIIIANEVTTGIGRTGRWFGFEHYDIVPDMVAIGKGIGNGYPVSVAVLSSNIAKRVYGTGFVYAQSHQNDALGSAVALEVIKVLQQEQLINKSALLGEQFKRKLIEISNVSHLIQEVRGVGMMLVAEFNDSLGTEHLSEIHRKLFQSGFLVGSSWRANLLRFYPALTISENNINDMLTCLTSLLVKEETRLSSSEER